MKIYDILEGKSENRELWDRIKSKGVVPSIDRERYTDMSGEGLEGPFRMKNGQVLYYDPKEGKYYNRDTDMYVDYDDYRAMNEEDNKNVGAQIADLIRKKNSVSSPVARKNIDSQIAQLKRQRNKTNEEQGVAEGDKRPGYVVKASDKPKKFKPSMGGESPHPYQGKLVGATESSQWGEPEDVLRQVLQTLEKDVEWPLTDVMEPQQVKQLLSPLMQAVSQKLNSLDEAEVGSTDYQWTHGKKPGGQGSWFFVAHRGGIDFGKDVEDQDYIQLHGMSYGEAKKAAIKWAKSKGHSQLFVAT